MKVSTSWINEWLCRTISDKDMVQALEQAGIEVEQFIYSKPLDKNIVVALVKKVIQHPGADRLKLVFVDNGEREVRIVCGAPNVAEGMKVPLAQVGATLPSGDTIKPAKLRGEASEGMLCSETELGLGPNHEGLLQLADDLVPGTALCDIYPSDAIVDIKTQANRFDLLSVVGLAREVAAMTNGQLKALPATLATEPRTADPEAAIEAGAHRLMLARIEVAVTSPSPEWMTARLRAAGVRAISPLVDITNYVNVEQGQPLHAYDAAKVKLPLVARQARAGETLTTLDGVKRTLTPQDLVIADASGPVGLAGVMGGASTEVDASTTEILLEAATLDAATVRKMAQRHGLRTEASARFERGLPVQLAPVALARAVELLHDTAAAKLTGLTDRLDVWPWTQRIGLRHSLLERLLGIGMTVPTALELLARLQIEARPFDIAAEARQHLGRPYKWGAKYRTDGTAAFDCSYFTDYLYSLIGLKIGHTAHGQWQLGRPVEIADLRPGDLLFRGGPWQKLKADDREGVSHVALYVGDGKLIHAANLARNKAGDWVERTTAAVIEEPVEAMTADPDYLGARRYADDLAEMITVPAVPWWRPDLKEAQDLVEEVVRVLGYDQIPGRIPTWQPRQVTFDQATGRRRLLQRVLYGAGLFEVMTYSFVSAEQLTNLGLDLDDHLKLKNPLSLEQAYLRSQLLASHLGVLVRNRTYAKSMGYYELSRVFEKRGTGEQPAEPNHLAIMMLRPAEAYRHLKGVLDVLGTELGLHVAVVPAEATNPNYAPDRLATVKLGRQIVGTIGQLAPALLEGHKLSGEAAYLEIDADRLLAAVAPRVFAGLERFPSTARDVAVVVPVATTWRQVALALADLGQVRVDFVSDYYGPELPDDHKSLALRLTITHPDRTPTEAEAADIERKVLAILGRKFNATVRA